METYKGEGGWHLHAPRGVGPATRHADDLVSRMGPFPARPRAIRRLGWREPDWGEIATLWTMAGAGSGPDLPVAVGLRDRTWVSGHLASSGEGLLSAGPGGIGHPRTTADLGWLWRPGKRHARPPWPLPVRDEEPEDGDLGHKFRWEGPTGWRARRYDGGRGHPRGHPPGPSAWADTPEILRLYPHLGTGAAAAAAGLVAPGEEETAATALRAAWSELPGD